MESDETDSVVDSFVSEYANYLLTSEDREEAIETANEYLFDRYAAEYREDAVRDPPQGLDTLADLPLSLTGELSPDVIGEGFDGVIARLQGQKETGSYYTPEEIVEFMVERAVRPKLRDELDDAGIDVAHLDDAPEPGELAEACSEDEAIQLLGDVSSLSILDPACGSGQFLVGAVDEVADYRAALADRADIEAPYCAHVWQTATSNVYGVDLLQEAVEMAKLRLKLHTLASFPGHAPEEDLAEIREGRALHWQIKQGNSLIGCTEVPEDVSRTELKQAALAGGDWA